MALAPVRPVALPAALALAAACALACAGAPPAPLSTENLPPDLDAPADVRFVRGAVTLSLSPEEGRFEGEVELDVDLARATSSIWLHARGLELREGAVSAGGAILDAILTQETAAGSTRLRTTRPVPAGRARLRVRFAGAMADADGAGIVRVGPPGGRSAVLVARALGARRAFPCLDDPSARAPWELTLDVPGHAIALSNAPVASESAVGPGRRRVRFAATSPLPAGLLFAAVLPPGYAAPADAVPTPLREAPLPVRVLAPQGEAAARAAALGGVRDLAPRLEAFFGAPAPAPELAVALVPGLVADVATPGAAALRLAPGPSEPAGRRALRPDAPSGDAELLARLAPALARGWAGGLTGAARWHDLWLESGLAALAGSRALEAARPDLHEPEWRALRTDAALAAAVWPGARALRPAFERVAEAEGSSDPGLATRAAALLDAWARAVGDERFARAVRAWVARPSGLGTTEDFSAELSRAAGRDLGAAFLAAPSTPAVPRVDARVLCDAPGPRVELRVGRARPTGAPVPAGIAPALPVCLRYEAAGAEGAHCTVVETGFAITPIAACPRWVFPGPGGAAPYRALLSATDRGRLRDAGLLHLAPEERLAWALGLRAAAEAGELPYGEALATLAPLAVDGDARVSAVPIPLVADALERLLPADLLDRARRRAADLYRPTSRALGLGPTPRERVERVALRKAVFEFLALVARDPETVSLLAPRGRALLGVGEPAQAERLAPSLALAALGAALDAGGAPVFDATEAQLRASADADERALLAGALGTVRDPALSARALALLGDKDLAPDDRARIARRQALQPETREAAWKAIQKRWDAVAAPLFGPGAAALPDLIGGLCDRDRAPAVQRTLEKRARELPALGPRIPHAIAALQACAALKDAQGASAAAWFAGK